MPEVPIPKEKWSGKITEVPLSSDISVGGERGMPFLSYEGLGRRQLVAGEVIDDPEIADFCKENPVDQAKAWINECGVDLICLKLLSTDPERKNTSPEDAAKTAKEVIDAVDVPVIVYGCGNEEKDPKVLEAVSNLCSSERLIIGQANENTYKSISAAATANGHGIVAFSNLDINLAKQMNILLNDFGVKLDNVIMDPLMAGLGMGLEYSYSVNERIRIAALMNDRMLQPAMICDSTGALDAREATDDNPLWGDADERGMWWEVATALAALMSGADIVIVRNKNSAKIVYDAIRDLRGE